MPPWTLPPQLTSLGAARNRRTTLRRGARVGVGLLGHRRRDLSAQVDAADGGVLLREVLVVTVGQLGDRRRAAVVVHRDEDHEALGRRLQLVPAGRAGPHGDEDVHAAATGVDQSGGGLDEVADRHRPGEVDVADVRGDAVPATPADRTRIPRLVDPLEDPAAADVAQVAGVGRRGEEPQRLLATRGVTVHAPESATGRRSTGRVRPRTGRCRWCRRSTARRWRSAVQHLEDDHGPLVEARSPRMATLRRSETRGRRPRRRRRARPGGCPPSARRCRRKLEDRVDTLLGPATDLPVPVGADRDREEPRPVRRRSLRPRRRVA